jgi:hypothetical protein
MDIHRIKGLDLRLDPSIEKICETSNATSSSTRSVLYVLLLVSILAIIATINSYNWGFITNWTTLRMARNENKVESILDAMIAAHGLRQNYPDSLYNAYTLEQRKKRLENNIRNEMDNVHMVKIPILGNSFDINDLGLIGGIAIFVMMFILRFTLTREASNLKIALQSITQRYPDNANRDEFATYIETTAGAGADETVAAEWLASINHTRRQHHYNFLSMNEIFTIPPLEVEEGKQELKTGQKLVKNLFWFPAAIYILVLLNDVLSASDGWAISKANTLLLLISEAFFLLLIVRASNKCTRIKQMIHQLYSDFKFKEYRYTE